MDDERCYITLLRHGRSRADDECVHEGRYDSPLTDTGRAQLARRAHDFKNQEYEFDAIVSSTLQRAAESATIVGAFLGVRVTPDAAWIERDNGRLAGMPVTEAAVRYPLASRTVFEPMAETGESSLALHCRAASALAHLLQRGPGRYLVVAHGGILNAAMRIAMGVSLTAPVDSIVFPFGDAGFASLAYTPSAHRWALLEFVPG